VSLGFFPQRFCHSIPGSQPAVSFWAPLSEYQQQEAIKRRSAGEMASIAKSFPDFPA
jgi:hypothetical protein